MRFIDTILVAAFLAAPAPLFARQAPPEVAAAAASGTPDDDRDNPRLDLLGLLGLAGLLGLIGREANIHVDARRRPRA